jgi:hypothetical protein
LFFAKFSMKSGVIFKQPGVSYNKM